MARIVRLIGALCLLGCSASPGATPDASPRPDSGADAAPSRDAAPSPDATTFPSDGGASDAGPDPSALHTGAYDITTIAMDDANIYWGDNGRIVGSIDSVPKTGGPVTIVYPNAIDAHGLFIAGGHAYWAEGYTVYRVALPSSATREEVTTVPDLVTALGTDGTSLYVSVQPSRSSSPGMYVAPLAGGAPTVLVTTPDTCLTEYMVVAGSELYCLGQTVFGTTGGAGLMSLGTDGSGLTYLPEEHSFFGDFIAADADDVYWTRSAFSTTTRVDGVMRREPFSGASASGNLLPFVVNIFQGMGLGGGYIYYTHDLDNRLHRIPIAGGSVDDIGSYPLLRRPTAVIADEAAAYVVSDATPPMEIVRYPH